MRRFRSGLSTVLLVLVGVIFPIGVLAAWAGTTIYDSDAFSNRAVQLLDSPAVRREVADRLTEQLARAGNEQAIAFRPAAQLAIEAVVDTDTFRSIFRTAVRRTHQALLDGRSGAAGLDLSDSFAIMSASLQLPATAQPANGPAGGTSGGNLGQSLADVTERAGKLHIWDLERIIGVVATAGLIGAVILAVLSVALSLDRRRAVARLGWVLVIDGALIILILKGIRVYAGRRVEAPELSQAVQGALARGTADLNTVGFWIMGYGVVTAAAAGALGDRATRLTPSVVRTKFEAWMARRRATTAGTVLLGLLGLLIGLVFIQDPRGNLDAVVVGAGLWLSYLSVVELMGLVRRQAREPAADLDAGERRRARVRRTAIFAGVAAAMVGLLTFGLLVTTRRAASRAEALGIQQCNGSASRCDLTLNQVVFPGTHNSMSSALYPGWLFGEQVNTIRAQLNAGVRALLVDTHYGVPSSARLPGTDTPIVLTDRAAGLVAPPGEEIDPAVVERATQLAARAPKAANAKRAIYLCHNYCELGAVRFSDVLGDVKAFLDTHPDEVVILDIQDATTPAETAAAIEQAGLGDRVATLHKGEPLPELRDLIDAGTTLVVFAEQGGPGGPPWYHQMYDWFQETPYAYSSVDSFDCRPNRGTAAAPMFLINHWVSKKGLADPAEASEANKGEVLKARMERCLNERGLMPNIVAVDFAGRGDVVSTAGAVNDELLRLIGRVGDVKLAPSPTTSPTNGPTTGPTTGPTGVQPEPVPSAPPLTVAPIEALTGGDPAAFCALLGDTRKVLYGWALAASTEAPADAGQDDLAFAPVLVRRLPAYIQVAPAELAARVQPILDRAQAGVAALTSMGLDVQAVAALADLADRELALVTGLDTTGVEADLGAALTAEVGGARYAQAAHSFAQAHPQAPDLFDLGTVSQAVAEGAGYGCLTSPVGLVDLGS